jgi:hypothetical protein
MVYTDNQAQNQTNSSHRPKNNSSTLKSNKISKKKKLTHPSREVFCLPISGNLDIFLTKKSKVVFDVSNSSNLFYVDTYTCYLHIWRVLLDNTLYCRLKKHKIVILPEGKRKLFFLQTFFFFADHTYKEIVGSWHGPMPRQ